MRGFGRCGPYLVVLAALLELPAARADTGGPTASAEVELDTAETLPELTQRARGLAASDPAQRARAFAALRGLGSGALPAIEKRLDAIARRGFDAPAALKAMGDLRRVQVPLARGPARFDGGDIPDAELDLARGVLPLLEADRGKGAVLVAELVALLRALEGQRSPEAAELIVAKLWPLDAKLFRAELPRTRARLGVLMIPGLLRQRAHARSHVRSACEEGLSALSISGPGRAVQQDDVGLLAAILRAYGDTLTFEAMPVVVTYLSDERLEVQKAALQALARFGRNAIWQLRERYVNATGKDPDPNWGHQRLRDELLRLFAAPKLAEFERHMAQAERALAEGAPQQAQAAADAALRVLPASTESARAVPIYDALARAFAARGELSAALTANARALRLAPDDAQADQRRARTLWLEGELRLATGQVDLTAYERALRLDPTLAEAQTALDDLTGKTRARERSERRVLSALAALLLLAAGVFTLRENRRKARPDPDEAPTPPAGEPA